MNRQTGRGRESGAVLIVALIMLLLITIVGVSAMQSTSMEERMAGNLYDRHTAFQAAEEALRKGESVFTSQYPHLSTTSGTVSLQMDGRPVSATYTISNLATYESSLVSGTEVQTTGMIVKIVAQSQGISGERSVTLESTYAIEE